MHTQMVAGLSAEQSSVAGMSATQGPTLAGCTLSSKTSLLLHFNQTLLGSESLLARPQTPQADWYVDSSSSGKPKLKTDSSGAQR
jgi:hypothetical protein